MAKKNELATIIADELNKQFKHRQVVYFLGEDKNSPTDVTEWVSTGSSLLDLAISNRASSGIPVGKITEINEIGRASCRERV